MMPVDREHWEHLKRWILSKRSDPPDCPICASGNTWEHWESESIAAPVHDTRGGVVRRTGTSLWSIAMICSGCGYTMHFDHERIGLILPYDATRQSDLE